MFHKAVAGQGQFLFKWNTKQLGHHLKNNEKMPGNLPEKSRNPKILSL